MKGNNLFIRIFFPRNVCSILYAMKDQADDGVEWNILGSNTHQEFPNYKKNKNKQKFSGGFPRNAHLGPVLDGTEYRQKIQNKK